MLGLEPLKQLNRIYHVKVEKGKRENLKKRTWTTFEVKGHTTIGLSKDNNYFV